MGIAGEDLDGSYSVMAQQGYIPNVEWTQDDKLAVTFHWMSEYDRVATEGEWVDHLDANGEPTGKAKFKRGSIKNPIRTNKYQMIPRSNDPAEKPIFNKKLYVKIVSPGEKGDVIDREATEFDKERFKRTYDAFVQGGDQAIAAGMPLDVLLKVGDPPILAINEIDTLKYFNVRTVEQLCSVREGVAPVLGFNDIQRKARVFLAATKANEPIAAQNKQIEELQKRIAELEGQKKQKVA